MVFAAAGRPLLSFVLGGTLAAGLKEDIDAALAEDIADLSPEEAAVLAFLQRRLETHAKGNGR